MINPLIYKNEVPDLREVIGWDRRDNDYPALFERCNFWAGVRDKKEMLIGFGYVAGMGMQHGYMEDILVHPDYQKQGIGVELVKELLRESEQFGLEIVTLTHESKHSNSYQTCGFTLCSGGLWRKK
ncbi:GNAT family N-acetyltransferase [Oceanobacillus sp. ISL-73]|nr:MULTISPECIES: GNAT family N-acetyltransferase [unclassified Oceanobacillus]MBT2599368.1 GNAT family N-acetyltransferase [Oceanobacillus sp. ISL-74]MBT2652286.1 GNAT family N-acetyltransferase [Oceanobacillus sp. ISL-73]